jgi:hypothetical protein
VVAVTRGDRLTRHELALEAGRATPPACLCWPGDGPCEAEGCGRRPTAALDGRRGEGRPAPALDGTWGATSCEGPTRARAAEEGGQGAPLELLVDNFDRWAVRPLGARCITPRHHYVRARGRS